MKSGSLYSKLCLTVCAVALGLLSCGAAVVMKPSIRPQWSGAVRGKWTMDYEAALAAASAQGRYTVMLFTGMWWCPHCQDLEANVLTTTEWRRYVKNRGLYLVAMDFPNRKGDGYWCWLWEESYRRKAGLTAEDATREIIRRYGVQDALSLPGGTRQVANNYVVTMAGAGTHKTSVFTPFTEEPQTEYTRIGYPTMLVIAPDGTVAGRFSVGLSNAAYKLAPFAYVRGKIDALMNLPLTTRWLGDWTLTFRRKGETAVGTAKINVNDRGVFEIKGRFPRGARFLSETKLQKFDSWGGWIPITDDELGVFALGFGRDGTIRIESENDILEVVDYGLAGEELPSDLYCRFVNFKSEIEDFSFVPWEIPTLVRLRSNGFRLETADGAISGKYTKRTGEISCRTIIAAVKDNGKYVQVPVTVTALLTGGKAYGSAIMRGDRKVADIFMTSVRPADYDDICDGDCDE